MPVTSETTVPVPVAVGDRVWVAGCGVGTVVGRTVQFGIQQWLVRLDGVDTETRHFPWNVRRCHDRDGAA